LNLEVYSVVIAYTTKRLKKKRLTKKKALKLKMQAGSFFQVENKNITELRRLA
jgi:hypothetical protein